MSEQEELTDRQKLAEKEAELNTLRQEIIEERERIRHEEREKIEQELKEREEEIERNKEEIENEEENRLQKDKERFQSFIERHKNRVKRILEELGEEVEEASLADDRERFQAFVKEHKDRIKSILSSKEEKEAERKELKEKAPRIVANDNQVLKKFVSDYKDRIEKFLRDLEAEEKEAVTHVSRKSTITGEAGDKFYVEAMPAPSGQFFNCWKVSTGDATIKDKNSEVTFITLKEENTTVLATYSVRAIDSKSTLNLKVGSGYVETEEEKKAREELEKKEGTNQG